MELTFEMLWQEFVKLRAQYDTLVEILGNEITFPPNSKEIVQKHMAEIAVRYGMIYTPPVQSASQEQEKKPHLHLIQKDI